MRFNIDDLRKGNVSKERIQEVVLQTILKVDPTKQNDQDIMRNASQLMSQLEKIVLFRPAILELEEEFKEQQLLDKMILEHGFFMSLLEANDKLLEFEHRIFFKVQEQEREALVEKIAALEKENQEKAISNAAYIDQLNQLERQKLNQLLLERDEAIARLGELNQQRDNLLKSIAQHETNIRAARKVYADEILKTVDDVKVGDVHTFENMNDQQKKSFVDGYMALEEIKLRKLFEIDEEIGELKQQLGKVSANQKGDTLLFSHGNEQAQIRAKIQALEAQKHAIEETHFKHIKRLGSEVGHQHINDKVPHEHAKVHHEAFRKHHVKQFKNYNKTVNGELKGIKSDKTNLVSVNNTMKENIGEVNEILKSLKDKDNVGFSSLLDITYGSQNSPDSHHIGNGLGALRGLNIDNLEIDILNNPDADNFNLFDLNLESLNLGELNLNDLDPNNLDMDSLDLNDLNLDDLDLSDNDFDDLNFSEKGINVKQPDQPTATAGRPSA